MSEIQKILEMIECVPPDDTKTLDEIDARVGVLAGHAPCVACQAYYNKKKDPEGGIKHMIEFSYAPKYTRSIDAQKDLQVKGWRMETGQFGDSWVTRLKKKASGIVYDVYSPDLLTEPLARLYAWLKVKEMETNDD